jgi:ubiquinone/menaquinone biosynthesis C-methylase UbiE
MNRGNAKMNAFAVRQLELDPLDRVLEVGFGGGVTLSSLLDVVSFVGGIDRSREMVDWAKARFAAAVAAGRADFRQGSVEAIPFEAASFGKAFTVNTVYFWRSLDAGFSDIHRVLLPGGRLVVGLLPKEWMDKMGHPADIFTTRTTNEVIAAISKSGFHDAHVERPEPTTRWNTIVATR